MSAVVCAIRGGPESQVTLETAINTARDKNFPLHLLYVVNLDFLRQVTGGHVQTVDEELVKMGDFILELAREDAAAEGVAVTTHIRHGRVTPQIIALANELNADYIVLGKRRPNPDQPTTPQSVVLDYIEQIRAETSADIVVVEQEAA